MEGKSPNIWIAGLLTSGGIGLFQLSGYANTDKTNFEGVDSSKNNVLERRADFFLDKPENPVKRKRGNGFSEKLEKPVRAVNRKQNVSKNGAKPPIELQLRADRQHYDLNSRRFIADGSVSVSLDGAILNADRIEFDRRFKTLYAKGSVRFRKGSQYFQASTFRYGLREREGVLKDVYGILDLQTLDKDLKLIYKGTGLKQIQKSTSNEADSDNKKANFEEHKTVLQTINLNSKEDITEEQSFINSFPKLINSENVWLKPNESSLITSVELSHEKDNSEIACPPLLPSIPNRHPQPWALTTWAGQMRDSDYGEALLFDGNGRSEYLYGIGINKRIYKSGPLSFELEGDFFRHDASRQAGGKYNQSVPFETTEAQNFYEGILAIVARVWMRPWLNFGIIEGVSYNTSVSNFERTNREKYSKLLNYLGLEIEAMISKKVSLVGRLHHRSGAFGAFSGAKGGSNAYLLGFRYHWGEIKQDKKLNTLPPPIGCRELDGMTRSIPKSIDDQLEIFSVENNNFFNDKQSINQFPKPSADLIASHSRKAGRSNYSASEIYRQRNKIISSIDQRIDNLKLRDRFSIQAKFGIPDSNRKNNQNSKTSNALASKIDRISRSKFITGSIKRWRVQASTVKINKTGWSADKMSFSNDPFTPTQSRIDARNVVAHEHTNGDMLITSARSFLVLEESLRVPVFKTHRIRKQDEVENRWIFGIDLKDRDGLFIGRSLKKINIGSNYELSLRPQFLIQRAIIDETNSYIANDSSITSDKVKGSVNTADLFGMKAKLRGKMYGWDAGIDANISTFNLDRIANGSRYQGSLKKQFDIPVLNTVETNLFGAYRYKVWNGSLGQKEIYTAYGALLDKKGTFTSKKLEGEYLLRTGAGRYQAETLEGGTLAELWRGNIYASLTTEYPIWRSKKIRPTDVSVYRYTPKPVVPSLTFETNISTSMSVYENNNSQSTITLTAGPVLTIGNFRRRFFDYTKLAISASGTLKSGGSPFAFDEAIDLATLGVGLEQQIAGPLLISTEIDLNVDGGSDYYGKTINSKIELIWQKRAYDFSIYYNPTKGIGGLNFRLNDFDFEGTGVPFLPIREVGSD